MLRRFIYLTLLLLLIYSIPLYYAGILRSQAASSLSPLAAFFVRQNTALVNEVRNLRQLTSLRQDKVTLQSEIITLQQQLIELENTKRENAVLRKELGISGITRDTKKVLAQVILRGNDLPDKTLTLSVGKSSGVEVGQPVVSQGVLVGTVINVGANSSLVRVVTSSLSHLQVWLTTTREKGLLEGDGNNLHLTNITQGVEVKEHQTIETSGLGGSLPQGILIGEVGSIESKKSDLSQRFFVNGAQDPASVETAFVLLMNKR